MYGYIYETINLKNGKKYIGQHKSTQFDFNYYGSGKVLLQAIEKEGLNNFICKILEPVEGIPTICNSEDELNNSEEFYITFYDCVNSSEYYNLKPGGLGKSESGLIYVRNLSTGKCKKIHQDELNRYLDIGYIVGGPIPTQETINKRICSNIGKKRTALQCQNMSNAKKGKPLSEEHKAKLRKPKKVHNWRKGLISLVKDDIQISVKPEEVDLYIANGFIRGAKKHSKASIEKHKKAALNCCCVYNGTVKKRPQLEDVDTYLEQGYWIVGKQSQEKYNKFKNYSI